MRRELYSSHRTCSARQTRSRLISPSLIDSLKVGSTKAEVSVLDLMTFYKVIGGNLAEVLEKNKNSHEVSSISLR